MVSLALGYRKAYAIDPNQLSLCCLQLLSTDLQRSQCCIVDPARNWYLGDRLEPADRFLRFRADRAINRAVIVT